MDEKDLQILSILQANGRASNAEIARQLGMAPSAVLERIRKLEQRGTIRGYRVNVRAERCPGLALEGVDAGGSRAMRLGSTPAREDPADWLWPHENDEGQWEARYGAGISLADSPGARVARCRANRAQNGLLLSR